MDSDLYHHTQTSSYTDGVTTSSVYRVEEPYQSFQSQFTSYVTSDSLNTDQSKNFSTGSAPHYSQRTKDNIKLVPLKVKDLGAIFKHIPEYSRKTPVKINVKENDIDQVVELQRSAASSVQKSLGQSIRVSPISVRHLETFVAQKRSSEKDERLRNLRSSTDEYASKSQREAPDKVKSPSPRIGVNPQVFAMTDIQGYPYVGGRKTISMSYSPKRFIDRPFDKNVIQNYRFSKDEQSSRSMSQSFDKTISPIRIQNPGPQVYATNEIQAYPIVGTEGFQAHRSPRARRPRKTGIKSSGKRHRSRKPETRPKHYHSRSRSPHYRSRRRHIPKGSQRRRSPVIIKEAKHSPNRACTPYPMCDYGCATGPACAAPMKRFSRTILREGRYPERMCSRPLMRQGQSRTQMTCSCNLCQEKLQFIQPGVCSKKKDMWTNEYAIIPKPQINLIDPCQELDPNIYPRAERPCIRDGNGNPLTDCIGRPLRDPVGKKFLTFTANGSVIDTHFNGNFYSGQPPVCVKCTLPGTSCAPDTTHNWWMGCGYPVKANMGPFFNSVVAAENLKKRCK